ncbi:MAG: hypothetical protein ACRDD2_14300 [Sarcina sp.]
MDNEKNSNHFENESTAFEEQLKELNHWQRNSSDPDYYANCGITPLPMKNLYKSPVPLIVVGILGLIILLPILISSFSLKTFFGLLFPLFISIAFLIKGISNFRKNNY